MANMPNQTLPPLALYIHLPWCVRKCPYCDFNSHTQSRHADFDTYVQALIQDFNEAYPSLKSRSIASVFFGGGTPSLFPAHTLKPLMDRILEEGPITEVTLEANPGTLECGRFQDYADIGINRISLGVQSFNDQALKALGRIHDCNQVMNAIEQLKQSPIDNWNIDLMYGLPNQSTELCLEDLRTALSFEPTHLSWYQLTLEPNTRFYHQPPPLPEDEALWDMHQQGHSLLKQHCFEPYEVSAFTQTHACAHNLNYWRFGDYLGIGAGAHSKVTHPHGAIERIARYRNPKDYVDPTKPFAQSSRILNSSDLIFEFMLNHLRLNEKVSLDLFSARTGLPEAVLEPFLAKAQAGRFIQRSQKSFETTTQGRLYLNDLMCLFMPQT